MTPQLNELAPDFTAPDQTGQIHKLSDNHGQKVLLYFYPKDDTPGCTKEACSVRDNWQALKRAGVMVLGVSADSQQSHQRFVAKYQLPFTLLSDPDKNVINLYGDDGVTLPKRISYLIDEEGKILKIYNPVQAATHAEDVLADLIY
ncbi:MAG: peroxiredoxin [bacterium]|nr:peroxiredoxin [bacterium]